MENNTIPPTNGSAPADYTLANATLKADQGDVSTKLQPEMQNKTDDGGARDIPKEKTSGAEVTVEKYETDDVRGFHTIHLKTPLSPGIYSLEIDFESAALDRAVLVSNVSENGEER